MNEITLNEIKIPSNLSFYYLEDTLVFQEKMLESLASLGFSGEVTMAETVASAVKSLEDSKADFILSDWNLPDGKGINFLRYVRLNPQFDKIPFLMVTTMDDVTNILDAVSLGADGYIVKPWDQAELTEKISFAYEKRSLGIV